MIIELEESWESWGSLGDENGMGDDGSIIGDNGASDGGMGNGDTIGDSTTGDSTAGDNNADVEGLGGKHWPQCREVGYGGARGVVVTWVVDGIGRVDVNVGAFALGGRCTISFFSLLHKHNNMSARK